MSGVSVSGHGSVVRGQCHGSVVSQWLGVSGQGPVVRASGQG